MAVQWENVCVFISSAFNDMHAERDSKVKQVFPQLQEWCERRKLRLVDVDLRWGMIEQYATQNRRGTRGTCAAAVRPAECGPSST